MVTTKRSARSQPAKSQPAKSQPTDQQDPEPQLKTLESIQYHSQNTSYGPSFQYYAHHPFQLPQAQFFSAPTLPPIHPPQSLPVLPSDQSPIPSSTAYISSPMLSMIPPSDPLFNPFTSDPPQSQKESEKAQVNEGDEKDSEVVATETEIHPSLHVPPEEVAQPRKFKEVPSLAGVEFGSARWSPIEQEILLAFLQQDGNYAKLKLRAKATWKELEILFAGRRTWNAIKGQWNDMKKRFDEVQAQINSTGSGLRDEQQWRGMLSSWIKNKCPYFVEIADILQRDKTATPPMASETGGKKSRVTLADMNNPATLEILDEEEEDTEQEETQYQPPQGGKKHPREGGMRKRKRDDAFRGSSSALDRFTSEFSEIGRKRLALDERRLIFEESQRAHEKELQEGRIRELQLQIDLARFKQ